MTHEDITELARAAGVHPLAMSEEYLPGLERLVALVRADEREACAKVAEKMLRFYTQAVTGVPEAIRARGQS